MANVKDNASIAKVDMKLEVIVIPVSDADRAKQFYARLGWRLDADIAGGNDFRVISSRRLTPRAQSNSARPSRRARPVQARRSWSFPTSWLPGTNWSPLAPK